MRKKISEYLAYPFLQAIKKRVAKQNISSLKLSSKRVLRELFIFLKVHVLNTGDYAAEIEAPFKEAEEQLRKHLTESSGYVTKLTGGFSYGSISPCWLSEEQEGTITKCIFKGIPCCIMWKVTGIGTEKSLLEAKFKLSPLIFKRLLICGLVLLFLNAGFYPTSAAKYGINGMPFIICFLVSVIFFINLGYLMVRYRSFISDVLLAISKKCDMKIIEKEYRDCPHRFCVNIKLLMLYGLPLFVMLGNSSPTPKSFIVVAILIMAFIAVSIKALRQGLVEDIKTIAIGSNIVIAALLVFLFVICPIVMTSTMKELGQMDKIMIDKYGADVSTIFTNKEQFPKVPLAEFSTRAKTLLYSFLLSQIFAITLVFAVLYFLFRGISKRYKKHSENIRKLFYEKSSGSSDKMVTLKVPYALKGFVWCTYFILSAMLWFGIYINLSILLVLAFPNNPVLHFGYGKIILPNMDNVSLMSNIHNVYGLSASLIVFLPMMYIFVMFILTHMYYAIKHSHKYYRMPHADRHIQEIADKIANGMNVGNIQCVIDKESDSPGAVIAGIKPKRFIVLPENVEKIFEGQQGSLEMVIAHEMAHLQRDCIVSRRYRILSRLGLVGSGFLSVLHDSVLAEDEADNAAKKYLGINEANADLYRGIITDIEAYMYINDKYSNASLAGLVSKSLPDEEKPLSLFLCILNPWLIIKKFYFETEIYDYNHRRAKYR